MPDINLLNDTTTPAPEREKREEPRRELPYTNPGPQRTNEPQPRVPSGFGQWLRGLFAPKQPKAPRAPKQLAPVRPILKSVAPDQAAQLAPSVSGAASRQSLPQRPSSDPTLPPPSSRRPSRIRLAGEDQPVDDEGRFDVNLLPDELAGKVNTRESLLLFGGIAFASVLVVGAFYVALTLYESNITQRTQETRTQRLAVDTSISSLRPEQRQAIAFKERTDTLKALLDQHITWSKFFATFERYVDRDVVFVGAFPGDVKGNIALQAQATDFTAVARQMVIFRDAKDFATEAKITAATVSDSDNGQVVSFAVQLTVNPAVFTETAAEYRALHGLTASSGDTTTTGTLP